MESTYKEYVQRLGYSDLDSPVCKRAGWEEDDEDDIPENCNVLALWPNGSFTAHFNGPNTVLGFFDAFDEVRCRQPRGRGGLRHEDLQLLMQRV